MLQKQQNKCAWQSGRRLHISICAKHKTIQPEICSEANKTSFQPDERRRLDGEVRDENGSALGWLYGTEAGRSTTKQRRSRIPRRLTNIPATVPDRTLPQLPQASGAECAAVQLTASWFEWFTTSLEPPSLCRCVTTWLAGEHTAQYVGWLHSSLLGTNSHKSACYSKSQIEINLESVSKERITRKKERNCNSEQPGGRKMIWNYSGVSFESTG